MRWIVRLTSLLCIPITYLLAMQTQPAPHDRRPTEFFFARLEYPGFFDDRYVKNWYTDYPLTDDHIVQLLNRYTNIRAAAVRVMPGSRNLYKFPMIYTVEPEQMNVSPGDIVNLREYITRGGFWFADDFHGAEEFETFDNLVRRILPDAIRVELSAEHPLFHIFFDIDKIEQTVHDGLVLCATAGCDQFENGESGRDPAVLAYYNLADWQTSSDNARILVVAAYNTDLGDGLEHADISWYPEWMSAYAAKLMTNIILWGLTH